jgi:hypothetical protein
MIFILRLHETIFSEIGIFHPTRYRYTPLGKGEWRIGVDGAAWSEGKTDTSVMGKQAAGKQDEEE